MNDYSYETYVHITVMEKITQWTQSWLWIIDWLTEYDSNYVWSQWLQLFDWLFLKNWFRRIIHLWIWKVTQWVQWGSQLWTHRRLRMIHWLYESDSYEQFQWCFTNLFDSLKNQIARVIHLLIGQQSLWCIWWCLQKTRAFIVAT